LTRANVEPIVFDGKDPKSQVDEMARMLGFINQLKFRIFDPNSKTFKTIFKVLNDTSGRGGKTEDIVEKKFNELTESDEDDVIEREEFDAGDLFE
jgi:hypothetical protein